MGIDRMAIHRPASFTLVVVTTLLALTLLAWSHRFIQDDAFISFRYAYNLAHGHGLVWNEGERVEGYTSFLHTLLMSLPIYLSGDPVASSFALGLLTFIGSLALTYGLAFHLLRSRPRALGAVILLGTNYSFSSYATGGLETQLQAGLFVACVYLLVRSMRAGVWRPTSLITLSVLLGLTLLTRLDSLLLVIVVLPVAIFRSTRAASRPARKIAAGLCLILPLGVLVGTWSWWQIRYYGDLLPNTYYVKAATSVSVERGAAYVFLFLRSYWLVPVVLMFLYFAKEIARAANRALLWPLVVVVLWSFYTVEVGGDFMEFRFLVPVLPLFFVLVAWVIFVEVRQVLVRAVLVAMVLLGSVHHAYRFDNRAGEVESVSGLSRHLSSDGDGWIAIGQALGKTLNHDPTVTIAVTAAGAIPYYSRLSTVDMLGLNDRWIARHGLYLGSLPGHQRMATYAYLLDRRVNLVLGYPVTVDIGRPAEPFAGSRAAVRWFVPMLSDLGRLPESARLVEIPISPTRKLLALYLLPSPRVDEALARYRWPAHALNLQPLDRTRRPDSVPILPAGTRVDFATAESDRYVWYGWSGRDFNLRWSTGNQAAIVFGVSELRTSALRVKIGRFLYRGSPEAQRLSVELNGTQISTLTLSTPEPREYVIELPAPLLREENMLGLVVPKGETLAPPDGRQDPPRLGVRLQWMELQTAGRG